MKTDDRPNQILKQRLEDRFYENIPSREDGKSLSNKEAGIEPNKKTKSITFSTKQADYNLRKDGLKDTIK